MAGDIEAIEKVLWTYLDGLYEGDTAKLDGILRSHQVSPNGTLRDTCVYSIIAAEWPTVKAHLNYQLNEKAR